MSRFLGQETSVIKLDVVAQAYAVHGHSCFTHMIQPDMPAVLLVLGLRGISSLFNVDLIIFAGDAVYARCFQAKVILDGLKELVIFLGGRATVLMLHLNSILLMGLKFGSTKGKEDTNVRSSLDVSSLCGGLSA